jgi:hypothetical protein
MTIQNPDYVDAYTNGGTGGLLAQVLSPWNGFGKFILVIREYLPLEIFLRTPLIRLFSSWFECR